MATIKSYTDLEQSKKLAKILPLKSADMIFVHTIDLEGDEHYDIDFRNNQPLFEDDICAWSLAALLSVLPRVDVEKEIFSDDTYNYRVKAYIGDGYIGDWFDNLVDACYEMILKLHELKML